MIGGFYACHETKIGYLLTEDPEYVPDTMNVYGISLSDSCSFDKNPYFELLIEMGFDTAYCLSKGIEPYVQNYYEDWKIHVKDGIPWQSSTIQGVQGTPPIRFRVEKAIAADGTENVDILKYFQVRGDGVIYLFNFEPEEIPLGKYRLSIIIENENDSREFADVFTVIVTERSSKK